jgi:uncharacterized membrane protein
MTEWFLWFAAPLSALWLLGLGVVAYNVSRYGWRSERADEAMWGMYLAGGLSAFLNAIVVLEALK